MSAESLAKLMALNYPLKIEFDEDDKLFTAEFLDLPGCSASGETVEEAYSSAQEVKKDWLQFALDHGLPVPPPSSTRGYSGRILARLPSSLHAMLADKAKLYGTSLNQYIVHLLSAAVIGDTLNQEVGELKSRLAEIEGQIAQLVTYLVPLHPQMTQRVFPVSTGVQSWEYSISTPSETLSDDLLRRFILVDSPSEQHTWPSRSSIEQQESARGK